MHGPLNLVRAPEMSATSPTSKDTALAAQQSSILGHGGNRSIEMSVIEAAQTANHENELQTALAQFRSALTQDQQVDLLSSNTVPDAESILAFTAGLDAENRRRKGHSVGSRVYTVLRSVRDFCDVIGIFVSSNPQIAALVWGSIRLTMQIIVNYTSYYEAVCGLFMQIGQFCPVFDQYAMLYADCKPLQKSLSDFHASIIRCCKHIVEALNRPWFTQILRAFSSSFDQEFEPDTHEIRRCNENVKISIDLAKAQDDKRRLIGIAEQNKKNASVFKAFASKINVHEKKRQQIWEHQEKRQAYTRKKQVLDAFCRYNPERLLKQNQRKRFGNTANWIFQTTEFHSWINKKGAPFLWCVGKIGSGKSILTSSVVDHLFLEKGCAKSPVSYFFVHLSELESLNAAIILRSLLRQRLPRKASDLSDEFERRLEAIIEDHASLLNTTTNDFRELIDVIELLVDVTPSLTLSYIVIDGFDELEHSQQLVLFEAFSLLIDGKPDTKIFVSCGANVKAAMPKLFSVPHHVVMMETGVKNDIPAYIHGIIQEKIKSEELRVGRSSLINEIEKALCSGADGIVQTFLLQLSLPKDVQHLHIDLTEADHFLGEICLTYLNFSDFQTALIPQPKDIYLSPRALVEGMDKGLRKTINLVETFRRTKSPKIVNINQVSVNKTNTTAATTETYNAHPFLKYAEAYWILHSRKFERGKSKTYEIWERAIKQESNLPTTSLPFHFEDSRLTKFALDTRHYAMIRLLLSRGLPASRLSWEQCLSEYIGRGDVTMVYTLIPLLEPERIITPSLYEAAECGHLRLVEKFIKLNANINAITLKDNWGRRDNGEWTARRALTALQVASFNERLDLVDILLRAGADVNISGSGFYYTALQAASFKGSLPIVERLILSGADVNAPASPVHGLTSLQAASLNGCIHVVETLLQRGADVNAISSHRGYTALQAAVLNDHTQVIDVLLKNGADYEDPSVLHMAARNGSRDNVERLLIAGAHVNVVSPTRLQHNPDSRMTSSTALQAAAAEGHLHIIEQLLAAGADVNIAVAGYARTPLDAAAYAGHVDVVERLLTAGADVDAPGSLGGSRTAIQIAAENGHKRVFERLTAAKAEQEEH
ncbi:hypothetical protein NPX13_g7256 [Xylaria arbuscula]|uniref:NACHT domain-containing protein n=1 Tax=Xylaria arbuscula TaxID=114810 RepID=A0A9W8NAP6_9PEZI|nr:hypothetical protein NPX13_g7256 [Xylaria arbuscula]